MARIPGTGEPEAKRRRPRAVRHTNWNLVVVVIFGPAVLLSHDPFIQAVLLPIALLAAAASATTTAGAITRWRISVATWPSCGLYLSGGPMGFDETNRLLDQLLQADAARRANSLDQLRAVAQRLDGSILPPVDDPVPQGDGRRARREVTAPAEPFVALPQRTTHGGRFGPAVAAKLRAEALRR